MRKLVGPKALDRLPPLSGRQCSGNLVGNTNLSVETVPTPPLKGGKAGLRCFCNCQGTGIEKDHQPEYDSKEELGLTLFAKSSG